MTGQPHQMGRRRRRGAFTLLELIAVLVLISTVLAIAAPSLRGFVYGRQTADAAAQILALTHLARSRAAAQGSTHRLNFDTEEGVYWLTAQQAGAFVDTEADHGRRYRLPVGVTVTVETPLEPEPAAQVSYVHFYPDGRSDQAIIELAGGEEQEVLHVTCESPSERFRILTPSRERRP